MSLIWGFIRSFQGHTKDLGVPKLKIGHRLIEDWTDMIAKYTPWMWLIFGSIYAKYIKLYPLSQIMVLLA